MFIANLTLKEMQDKILSDAIIFNRDNGFEAIGAYFMIDDEIELLFCLTNEHNNTNYSVQRNRITEFLNTAYYNNLAKEKELIK